MSFSSSYSVLVCNRFLQGTVVQDSLLKSVHFKNTVTSADFALMSADLLLKMVIVLSEMRIA